MPIYVVSRVSTSGTRQTFQDFILSACENMPPGARHELDTNGLVANQVQNTPGAIGYVDEGTASQLNMNTVLINGQQALSANVEKNTYKFWAIEHMYTKGLPQGLAKAFLDYMTGDTARVIVNSLHYVDYNLMSRDAIMSHQGNGVSSTC
jgi:phosphate transport system substrate-binding protein